MDIELLYIKVQSPSDPSTPLPPEYDAAPGRFAETYARFRPGTPHRLTVICCNGEKDRDTERLFEPLGCDFSYYVGGGRDIGAFQAVACTRDADLVVCLGAHTTLWRSGWLERLVESAERHGPGVYAPMASYEASPHLRTCCFALSPPLLRAFPHRVETREQAYRFEHGEWNFSDWVTRQGGAARMVTWCGSYALPDWRRPANIFRRGDQSNCLVHDRHTDLFDKASEAERSLLSARADGLVT